MYLFIVSLLCLLAVLASWLSIRCLVIYFASKKPIRAKTWVVLGSGGHTAEMLCLIKNLDFEKYHPVHFLVANTDTTSLPRLKNDFPNLVFGVSTITRSREVGQSWLTVILPTIKACLESVLLICRSQPDVILCNGPGTCLPICLSGLFLRCLLLNKPKIVFIESFCRVKTLSLTGKLLYYLSDEFITQWPNLQKKYPRAKYLGPIY
eukprot:maker-scaffold_7-snap-gene-11.41-mRNA-1 protein AED:0.02 eAED:0.02 QI:74/1/1/1/0/0/2/99/206